MKGVHMKRAKKKATKRKDAVKSAEFLKRYHDVGKHRVLPSYYETLDIIHKHLEAALVFAESTEDHREKSLYLCYAKACRDIAEALGLVY